VRPERHCSVSVLRKLFWAVVVLPLAVVVIALAVANRHTVSLVLDPTAAAGTAFSIELPLYLLLFAALGAGLLLGGFTAWLGQGKWRKLARERRGEAARWRREAERLSGERAQAERTRLPVPANGE